MPRVKMSGKFLGGEVRQYDKKDGSGKAMAGSYWLWDEDGQTATELRPDRDLPFAVAASMCDGLNFGDEITVSVEIRVFANGTSFSLMGVDPRGKAAG